MDTNTLINQNMGKKISFIAIVKGLSISFQDCLCNSCGAFQCLFIKTLDLICILSRNKPNISYWLLRWTPRELAGSGWSVNYQTVHAASHESQPHTIDCQPSYNWLLFRFEILRGTGERQRFHRGCEHGPWAHCWPWVSLRCLTGLLE